jgi:hypothetical protein
MALAFQAMLKQFGLTDKIHTVNADNATAKNKQTTKLDVLPNSFKTENCIRCFNHTLQLSTKSLLAPFNPAISQKATQDDKMPEEDDNNQLILEDNNNNNTDNSDADDADDRIDELEELSKIEQVQENTTKVCKTVTNVSNHKAEDVRLR